MGKNKPQRIGYIQQFFLLLHDEFIGIVVGQGFAGGIFIPAFFVGGKITVVHFGHIVVV